MIRGYIDFSQLDRQARIDANALAQGRLTLPGLHIEFGDVLVFHDDQRLLLIAGQPLAREARLFSMLKHEGWASQLPWITASPHNIVPQLGGRFGLLWLDVTAGTLGFATDRFATHPFCYVREDARLSFANRADEVPALRRELSPQALLDYLHFHVIPAPHTIFEGVRRLAPASLVAATSSDTALRCWWTPHFEEPKKGNVATQKEIFRTILDEAVRRAADGAEVGAFLSGGTDSSTIAGLLAVQRGTSVKAYSIGFEAAGYDEIEYARIAAKHFGLDHRIHYVTPDEVAAGVPVVAAHYDQPFGNSSAVPAWYCARMAHDDGTERMIAGDGGDELFGGNVRYAEQNVFALHDRMPVALWNATLGPLMHGIGAIPGFGKLGRYATLAESSIPQRFDTHNLLARLGHANVMTTDLRARVDTNEPAQLRDAEWQRISATAPINRMLAFDWRFTLADNDLPKVIGTTQLAGVEVAFPFLDDDLLEYSMSLPPRFKLRGKQLRWFFKKALLDFLPRQIVLKQKHGFGLPFGQWALTSDRLRAVAADSLASLGTRNIVRADFLDSLLAKRVAQHPGYYGEMVWIAMMLEQWLRVHAPEYRLEPR